MTDGISHLYESVSESVSVYCFATPTLKELLLIGRGEKTWKSRSRPAARAVAR